MRIHHVKDGHDNISDIFFQTNHPLIHRMVGTQVGLVFLLLRCQVLVMATALQGFVYLRPWVALWRACIHRFPEERSGDPISHGG